MAVHFIVQVLIRPFRLLKILWVDRSVRLRPVVEARKQCLRASAPGDNSGDNSNNGDYQAKPEVMEKCYPVSVGFEHRDGRPACRGIWHVKAKTSQQAQEIVAIRAQGYLAQNHHLKLAEQDTYRVYPVVEHGVSRTNHRQPI